MANEVLTLLAKSLVAAGYDGLVGADDCSCQCDDLAPCGGDPSACVPGYRHERTDDCRDGCEWATSCPGWCIRRDKED